MNIRWTRVGMSNIPSVLDFGLNLDIYSSVFMCFSVSNLPVAACDYDLGKLLQGEFYPEAFGAMPSYWLD